MQDRLARLARVQSTPHNLSFIAPNRLKFVPEFFRLIEVQLSWRNLCPEMATRSSKLACKNIYETETLDKKLELWSLSLYDFIIMLSHAISTLIHALTHISMHMWQLGKRIRLIEASTNLRNMKILKKQNSQLETKHSCLSFFLLSSFFLSFLSCFWSELFSSLLALSWPKSLFKINQVGFF